MKKILWVTNYGYQNSFAFVSRKLLSYFINNNDKYELYFFCIGIMSDTKIIDKVNKEIGINKNNIAYIPKINLIDTTSEDKEYLENYIYGVTILNSVIKRWNIDLIISLCDLKAQVKQYKSINYNSKFVPYLVIDYDDGPIYKFKKIITPSLHSFNLYKRLHPKSEVYLLPHIVNVVEKKNNNKIFININKKFKIVCCATNDIRKRIDITIKAFEIFSENKNNVELIIKTNKPIGNKNQYDFYNNNDKIKIITQFYNDYELENLYKNADIGITTNSGEGFGLTPCEMSLYKVPQLIPNNTSHPWIFGDNYYGLINTYILPEIIARGTLKKITVIKSYKHYETQINVKKKLEISEYIKTIIWSNNNFNDLINQIKNYDRIQILVNIEDIEKFLNSWLDIDLYKKLNMRKTSIIDIINLKEELKIKVKLPYINDLVYKMNELYDNKILRENVSQICYERIKRFSSKEISKIFKSILNSLIN
jgi:hypothetical protein